MKLVIFRLNKDGSMLTEQTLKRAATTGSLLLLSQALPITALAKPNFDQATKPLIDFIESLAKPAARFGWTMGLIKVGIGKEYEGWQQVKLATFGYAGIRALPWYQSVIDSMTTSLAH